MIVKFLVRRRRDREEAERLMRELGDRAWEHVYRRCRDRSLPAEGRATAYRVRRLIERAEGIAPRVDTATRYLDPDG